VITVDASAIVAILLDESDGDEYLQILMAGPSVMSPISYWEAAVAARRSLGVVGHAELDGLINQLAVRIEPITETTARAAVRASALFGRHTKADLNLGDCFSYALAKEQEGRLLYKGNDFIHTDLNSETG
jgi:ribonuclease VapC